MSETTDELRQWAETSMVRAHNVRYVRECAGYIDSEMIVLPRDARGIPIHVGDAMSGDGTWHVAGLRMYCRNGQGDADDAGGRWEVYPALSFPFDGCVGMRPEGLEHAGDCPVTREESGFVNDLRDWARLVTIIGSREDRELDALVSRIGEEMLARPTGADGMPIRVGDRVLLGPVRCTVRSIVWMGKDSRILVASDGDFVGGWVTPLMIRH